MAERNSNSQINRYSNCQVHLHKTHQDLQRLAKSSGKIQNQSRRVSNNLIQSCPEHINLVQIKNFRNARKELNTSIKNLTNLTHDITEFWQFLVPFNTPPSPTNSCSRFLSSRGLTSNSLAKSSDPSKSPSLLNDDYNTGNPRKHTIKEYTAPLPGFTYTVTAFGEPPPYQFSSFRTTVDPQRLSDQALDREQPQRPSTTKQ